MRCILEKITQVEKSLHDRPPQRSWQISSLAAVAHTWLLYDGKCRVSVAAILTGGNQNADVDQLSQDMIS